jgi:type IV pilus assembly protein PilE
MEKEYAMVRSKGFTLMELMIVIAIIGILAAIALPSYNSYIIRANRAAAKAFMLDLAARQKQYFLDVRSYAADLTALNVAIPSDVVNDYGTFQFTVSGPPPAFVITATPTSSRQSSDGPLTLSSDGTKTPAAKW